MRPRTRPGDALVGGGHRSGPGDGGGAAVRARPRLGPVGRGQRHRPGAGGRSTTVHQPAGRPAGPGADRTGEVLHRRTSRQRPAGVPVRYRCPDVGQRKPGGRDLRPEQGTPPARRFRPRRSGGAASGLDPAPARGRVGSWRRDRSISDAGHEHRQVDPGVDPSPRQRSPIGQLRGCQPFSGSVRPARRGRRHARGPLSVAARAAAGAASLGPGPGRPGEGNARGPPGRSDAPTPGGAGACSTCDGQAPRAGRPRERRRAAAHRRARDASVRRPTCDGELACDVRSWRSRRHRGRHQRSLRCLEPAGRPDRGAGHRGVRDGRGHRPSDRHASAPRVPRMVVAGPGRTRSARTDIRRRGCPRPQGAVCGPGAGAGTSSR